MGGVDYIYKPINPELLRVKVGVFVELYRKNHELLSQEKKLLMVNKNLEKEIEERKIKEEKIKLLNQQLTENNTHLKNTNQELDRFAYVASHDLQEPLRKMMLFTERLNQKLQGKVDDDVEVYLNKVSKASQRMQQLVNDLLRFSRHTNDILEFEKTDLNEVLHEVLSDMEIDIQKREAIITSTELPSLHVIPSQIRQLFQNLISNSLKFCLDGCTPQIHIKTEVIKGSNIPGIDKTLFENTFYKIYIRDNGIGFDAKYSEDIFVVFKRLHSYHQFEGTGIGLSICKKIVEKHKGYISAHSKLNEGSTFVITLPEKIVEI
jgi:light-regulated signal transduction histidine kinase (bacteriophytochrome)